MLFVLLSSLIGLSSAGSDPDTSNYFIDEYNGGLTYYAYPMDICMKTGVTEFEYVTYSCSADSTTVTKTIYDDEDCMTVSASNGTIEFTDSDITDDGIFDFNCGGLTQYVELEVYVAISQADECSNPLGGVSITYSAVDVCHYSGGTGENADQLYTTCNKNGASVSTYVNQTDCTTAAPSITLTAEDECTYFTDADVDGIGTLPVFSIMTSCVVEGDSSSFMVQVSTPTMLFVCAMAIMKIFE